MMGVVDDWVKGATREQLIAKRDEYNAGATEAWHGRDNNLRLDMLRAINARLAELDCGAS
jgi:hypothetical protein